MPNNIINYELVNNIINIIIGMMIGIILGYIFLNKAEYHGLDSNDVVKEIHTDKDGRKYRWKPQVCMCLMNKKK